MGAQQPQLDDAMRQGERSAEQASEIAGAAEADAGSTGRLLEQARTRSLKGLKEQARAVRLAGRSAEDDQARAERLHRGRYVRYWTDREGAGRLDGRLAPERFAEFLALQYHYPAANSLLRAHFIGFGEPSGSTQGARSR